MHDLPLVTTIAAAFAAAWVFGIIAQRIGLSPIVGYLLAGIAIGPYTPGFSGDPKIAHQLAELGVILLMFGVGLHFHVKDLLAVKWIAIPGALVQSAAALAVSLVVFWLFGWSWKSGVLMGAAMAVASTVVLLRGLMDRDLLKTVHGHVAVGWLIVEDILTVVLLVLIPTFAPLPGANTAGAPAHTLGWAAILWALGKLGALVLIVMLAGSRVVPWVLTQVAGLRSRELFTLTVLVMSIAVAVGSAWLFGASAALGAFLAGMVVGQSTASHQAASDILPLRDAFAVLFFVSVGMVFDPAFIVREPALTAAAVAIVLIAKPIAALAIVAALGYSVRTALTVAVGLGQIGEFSFILAQVSLDHGIIPEEGTHLLVAAAMISITINPFLFASIDRFETLLQRSPRLWRILNARAASRIDEMNASAKQAIAESTRPLAVIVGYGPVGRVVDALLRDGGMDTVVIDQNMDTVQGLMHAGRKAIFGDATRQDILETAGIARADHLVITLPHSAAREPLIMAARQVNPRLEITVRARYLKERPTLEQAGATTLIFEEGEAGIALARHIMARRGVDEETIERMLIALRKLWLVE